ncbi:MAG: hypothetical protein NVSMB14_11570 [Isosphaeraceae bacterium]
MEEKDPAPTAKEQAPPVTLKNDYAPDTQRSPIPPKGSVDMNTPTK